MSSTRLDKTECDARTQLISEQFKAMNDLIDESFGRFEAEVNNLINSALLKGLTWVTVLIFGLFGVLWALIGMLK
ncbi:MAG TPA: hypothetical protein GXX30_01095 [Firmicutes bacterium]|nr:hypothetical protein [Candidatus Fermentithermobacillaceae bacterium]